MGFQITGDSQSDAVLDEYPFAILTGMLLDQQYPMEHAFRGPAKILDRFGTLDPARIAAADPEEFAALCATPPAVHRFPGSMAARVRALAQHVSEVHGGDAARVWTDAASPDELRANLEALPGFGEMKVKALAAVLAKRYGVETATPLVPAHPTLGDVDSPAALAEYQASKRAHKAELRAQRAAASG